MDFSTDQSKTILVYLCVTQPCLQLSCKHASQPIRARVLSKLFCKIKYKLYAQARHLHPLQSQGNFWNCLTFVMRNFGKIRCEFQTAGYLVFLKPYPVAGCVDTAYWNAWIFQHGVVFHAEPVRNVRVRSFRRFPEKPTNRYLQPIYFSRRF